MTPASCLLNITPWGKAFSIKLQLMYIYIKKDILNVDHRSYVKDGDEQP